MDKDNDNNGFQVVKNNFKNKYSEFVSHTNLKTSAHLGLPYYAQLSITTTDNKDEKIIGVKSFQSILLVKFEKTAFVDHKKLMFNHNIIDKLSPSTFTFQSLTYATGTNVIPKLIIGYKNGLITVCNSMNSTIENILNYDDKLQEPIKKVPPMLILPLPALNYNGTKTYKDEILVVFNDSTIMKYDINCKLNNSTFRDKLKKFDDRIIFTQKPEFTKKTVGAFTLGAVSDNQCPQFKLYYGRNDDELEKNPREFLRFSFRTVSDVAVVKNPPFAHMFIKGDQSSTNTPTKAGSGSNIKKTKPDVAILALVTYDGYFIMYDYIRLEPIYSFKSRYGGYNSLTFSQNNELVALSGHDDSIVILNLMTNTYLKCEGHKSFISKVIFQDIPYANPTDILSSSTNNTSYDIDTNNNGGNGKLVDQDVKRESYARYNRIIAASFDGSISIWEFEDNDFCSNDQIKSIGGSMPTIINAERQLPAKFLEALVYHKVDDAAGWIQIIDNLLFVCTFDGHIATFIIKDLVSPTMSSSMSEKDDVMMMTNTNFQEMKINLPQYNHNMGNQGNLRNSQGGYGNIQGNNSSGLPNGFNSSTYNGNNSIVNMQNNNTRTMGVQDPPSSSSTMTNMMMMMMNKGQGSSAGGGGASSAGGGSDSTQRPGYPTRSHERDVGYNNKDEDERRRGGEDERRRGGDDDIKTIKESNSRSVKRYDSTMVNESCEQNDATEKMRPRELRMNKFESGKVSFMKANGPLANVSNTLSQGYPFLNDDLTLNRPANSLQANNRISNSMNFPLGVATGGNISGGICRMEKMARAKAHEVKQPRADEDHDNNDDEVNYANKGEDKEDRMYMKDDNDEGEEENSDNNGRSVIQNKQMLTKFKNNSKNTNQY